MTDTEVKCYSCEKVLGEGESQVHNGHTYCEDCYSEQFITCEACGDVVGADTIESFNGDMWCHACVRDNTTHCEECDEHIHNDDAYDFCGHTMLCRSCYENREEEDGIPERDWCSADLPQFQSVEAGSIITSTRLFSAEIECYDHENNVHSVADSIPKEYGISSDGSLNSDGVEFQTPKLAGKQGQESLEAVCAVINDAGMTTDRSTGLHIHLDGRGLIPTNDKRTPDNLIDLWVFYLSFEEVILSFLPPSRRRNSYCRLLRTDYNAKDVQECKNIDQLERLWYSDSKAKVQYRKTQKYDSSRYAGVNIHSLLKDGHIEIRYHSGTTNARKILEWTALHQAIVDTACDRRVRDDALRAQSMPSLEEKTAYMYDLLQLPERARAYFTERQVLFSSTAKDNSESVNETEPCVG